MSRLTLLALVAVALCSMGARTGCGGSPLPASKLCTSTGGTWDSSDCPKSCWPPACGAAVDQVCDSTCGTEAVCQCPADKPYWKDGQGCWSEAECAKTCKGMAKGCDEFNSFWGTGDCLDQEGCTRSTCTCYQTCCDTCHRTKWVCDANNNCHYENESYDCNCKDCNPYTCWCGDCFGTVTACSALSDPQVCQEQDGCRWE